jgi:hypothetical protein
MNALVYKSLALCVAFAVSALAAVTDTEMVTLLFMDRKAVALTMPGDRIGLS